MLYYCVGSLELQHPLAIYGKNVDLKLSWAEGMVGCIPVFKDRETAKKYAGDKNQVFTVMFDEGQDDDNED